MPNPATIPCADPLCDGEMTHTPRNPFTDTPPRWTCDECGKVVEVDDDPGTGNIFGEGAD